MPYMARNGRVYLNMDMALKNPLSSSDVASLLNQLQIERDKLAVELATLRNMELPRLQQRIEAMELLLAQKMTAGGV